MKPGLLLAAVLLPVALVAEEPVDLDDVYCALCHFEEGDEFAASIHYQRGLLLCNDCHGGLPFEAETDLAKAPDTGFIGKPGRQDIAAVCAKCHSGPADFFARGPHHDCRNEANPTCITCHHNHRVMDATLALMDETCTTCHAAGSAPLEEGEEMRRILEVNQERLQHFRAELDSLVRLDRSLRRALPYVEGAGTALREADPITHALKLELVEEKVEESHLELEQARGLVADYFQEHTRRRWIVVFAWVVVLGNVALLWLRRRQLDADD